MDDSLALGIDLGGSKIYAVVTDASNRILASAKRPTENTDDPRQLITEMIDTGISALNSIGKNIADMAYIGAALPSPINPQTGDCSFAVNLDARTFSARQLFYEQLRREVVLGNDGDLGTLAEYEGCRTEGITDLIGFFIGTGLGGGLILNGQLVQGNSGLAGEMGHLIIRKGGRRCSCGNRGCAEAYCSKRAFVKAIHKGIRKYGMDTLLPKDKFDENTVNIKSKYLAKAYEDGDLLVRKAVDKGAYMLGIAAASVCAVVTPQRIVLGGGVMTAMGQYILPIVRKSFEANFFGNGLANIQIVSSLYGDNAVALGAAMQARRKGDR